MEGSHGAKAANDNHFSRRRRWRQEHRARSGCVVFSWLLGWVSKIANGSTGHRRGQLDMSFSQKIAYETILTFTLTKQALSPTAPLRTTWLSSFGFRHLATWLDHLRNSLTPRKTCGTQYSVGRFVQVAL